MEALVVIDVQNGMFGDEKPHDGEAVVSRIQGLIRRARAAGTPVFFVQHNSGPEGPLNQGTPGFDFRPELAPAPGESVTVKNVCSAFRGSNLDEKLRAAGVDKVVVCGMQTEFCVDTNVRMAFEHGYGVTVAADAHTTFDGRIPATDIIRHHNGIFYDFAKLKPAAEITFG